MKSTHSLIPSYIRVKADTLLIADSNAVNRNELQNQLQPSFEVATADDGANAFDVACKLNPNLVILNINLKGVGAFAICEKLKACSITRHVPVIILTKSKEMDTIVRGFAVGADDLITTPFSILELKARVCSLINNRNMLRYHFEQQFRMGVSLENTKSIEEKFLHTINEVINKNIGDPNFSVNKFAQDVGVSNAKLYRKLFTLTGLSPNDFIRDIRLERAVRLLSRHTGNISEVAYQVGFSNLSYFSKCFRGKFGVIPSEFLKNKEAYPFAFIPRLPLRQDFTGSTFYPLQLKVS